MKSLNRSEKVFLPYPRTCPRGGDTLRMKKSCVHLRFIGVLPHDGIPDFGRFRLTWLQLFSMVAMFADLPHRSREYEFSDGRV
jgi:hypothetical protein